MIRRALFFNLSSALAMTLIIGGAKAFAEGNDSFAGPFSTEADPACLKDVMDPYDHGFRITRESWKYAGQCVNIQRMRAPEATSAVTDSAANSIHFARFANFLHQNQFWIAEVPRQASIRRLIWQVENFNIGVPFVKAAHAQLRIQFDESSPVRLYPQSASSPQSDAQLVNDITISAEAFFPEGVAYNFATGMMNNYPLGIRVLSTADRIAEHKGGTDDFVNRIDQYEVQMNQAEANEFLSKVLDRSLKRGLKYFYNTLRPNCVSEIFDALDEAVGSNGAPPFKTGLSTDPVAGPSLAALKARGRLGAPLPSLNEETKLK